MPKLWSPRRRIFKCLSHPQSLILQGCSETSQTPPQEGWMLTTGRWKDSTVPTQKTAGGIGKHIMSVNEVVNMSKRERVLGRQRQVMGYLNC